MKKRLVASVFLALLLLTAAVTILADPQGAKDVLVRDWDHPAAMAENLELFFQKNLPLSAQLKSLYLTLNVAGGSREFDGLILTDDGLVQNFTVSGDATLRRENTKAILDFSRNNDIPSFMMLLPTACAIYQDRLPSHTPLYNQRSYLEEVGRQLTGNINVVDVYLPLYYNRTESLYYRTSPQLTALGQYTVYQTLAKRLGFSPRPLEDFDLCRMPDDYYGPLYQRWAYGGVKEMCIRDRSSSFPGCCASWRRLWPPSLKPFKTLPGTS